MSPWGCGWHVDRLAFDRMLLGTARQAGAVVFSASTALDCNQSNGDWTLRLLKRHDDGSEHSFQVQTRVLIDATGRGARLAR